MELMINFILGLISSICIGLATNYIYDKIKNHSSSANRKSGLEFEFECVDNFVYSIPKLKNNNYLF